jgi:hypothetical protein
MSKVFPREKDNIIDDLDEMYDLDLDDEQADRLRAMTAQQLLLITSLIARSVRIAIEKEKSK